jgi:hypothetical protein
MVFHGGKYQGSNFDSNFGLSRIKLLLEALGADGHLDKRLRC